MLRCCSGFRTGLSRKPSVPDVWGLGTVLMKLSFGNSDFFPMVSTANLERHLRGSESKSRVNLSSSGSLLLPCSAGLAVARETIPSRSPMSTQMPIQTFSRNLAVSVCNEPGALRWSCDLCSLLFHQLEETCWVALLPRREAHICGYMVAHMDFPCIYELQQIFLFSF